MDMQQGPVVLVVSPHAGHIADQSTVEAALGAAGVTVGRILPVSELDEQAPQGQAWHRQGFTAAVAAGGDGTVGAVATQVAASELPLGILPLGTSNDVARSLAIPLTLDAACTVVAHGTAQAIDLGYACPAATAPGAVAALRAAEAAGSQTPELAHSEAVAQAGAYFLHTLTLGLNVEFARLATDAARRQRWGPLTYAASAVEAVTQFKPVTISLQLEGVVPTNHNSAGASDAPAEATRTLTCEVIQVAVVITPVFGGSANLRLPGVALRDRLIDILVFEALERGRLRALLERLMAAWTPAHAPSSGAPDVQQVLLEHDLPGLLRFKAQTARIDQPEGLDMTLDGEVRARTPIEVSVAPDALRVLLPADLPHEVLDG
jgi:diacylglycerol kinase family enzyme